MDGANTTEKKQNSYTMRLKQCSGQIPADGVTQPLHASVVGSCVMAQWRSAGSFQRKAFLVGLGFSR